MAQVQIYMRYIEGRVTHIYKGCNGHNKFNDDQSHAVSLHKLAAETQIQIVYVHSYS